MEYDAAVRHCPHCLAVKYARASLARGAGIQLGDGSESPALRRIGITCKLTLKDLLDKVLESRLLSEEEVEPFVRLAGGHPGALLEALVDAGRLTAWQATKLAEGRCQGFFLGDYKLTGAFRGAMYRATHVLLDQQVVIDVTPPDVANRESALRQWYGRVGNQITVFHPSLARVLNAGKWGIAHFLVRDDIPGEDLSHICQRPQVMPLQLCAALTAQMACAAAHVREFAADTFAFAPSDLVLSPTGLLTILNGGPSLYSASAESPPQDVGTEAAAAGRFPEWRSKDHDEDVRALGRCLSYMVSCHTERRGVAATPDDDVVVSKVGQKRLFEFAFLMSDGSGQKLASTANEAAVWLGAWLSEYGEL